MTAPARTLTVRQYQQFVATEGARRHRASTRATLVYYLPRRNAWMTARAGRRGTVTIRLYPRCPCEDG